MAIGAYTHHQTRHPAGSQPVVDLLGRTHELELIDALLAGRSDVGPGLLLRGELGVGKTALLDVAAARAEAAGMQVLRASGAQFETEIRFSALHQLIYPLSDHVDRLAGHQRVVLHQILGLTAGSSPDPLAVATAVRALLREAAAERPLLVLIDAVPWIDRASATVLGFSVRRIGDDPIMFLAAARTDADGIFDQVGLLEHEIGPLAEQPAAALLDAQYPDLPPQVRQRLLAEAPGNPLALRELPASLTDQQRRGQDALPAFLPLNRRLKAVFAAQMRALPAPARKLLLLAALEAYGSLATIRTAAQGRMDVDDLAPADQANLVRVDADAGVVSFRYPLIRSAIVQLSSQRERRAAHRALAAALTDDPSRRAWHLAEAATGPDEVVASALDQAALAAWQRGAPSSAATPSSDNATVCDRRHGASAAVVALVRAGELSPHPADRCRRLVEAAFLANMTGQFDQVPRLLADAGQAPDTPTGLVFAVTAHLLAAVDGDMDAAHRLLARALDYVGDAPRADDWDSYGILFTLLLVGVYGARPEPWELLKSAMARFASQEVAPFQLCYDAFVDPARTADTVRDALARAFPALPTDAAPWQVVPLAYAAVGVDALSDYRYLVRRMVEQERDGGAITMVIAGLLLLCIDSYHRGQWDEAEDLTQEGLDLAAAHGYHLLSGQHRVHLTYIAAARGNLGLARTLDEITTWAAPRRVGMTEESAGHTRTFIALSRGDYEAAYAHASRVNPADAPNSGLPGRWTLLDLVEAAVRTGRTDQARAHVAAAQQAGIDRISTHTALITAGAAALAADDDQAGPLFEAALSLPEADRWPFEQARIQLAYGQRLRRTRDTTRARLHLRAALGTFDRLGARPWATRAHNELRATGITTITGPDTSAALTAQERQIATMAATGLTNKQIGQQLHLSHRTVGGHLHRIFPKLGITSRAALRDALETLTPSGDEHAPQPASPAEGKDS
ncbi:AAA family ATPase [Dactylosporangium sp. McL0621]|uniref:AAA family ATPase n=1 Tax=Dactylosporangium sp. McL0621 TaxID=3415678 RepID=UPI003CF38413